MSRWCGTGHGASGRSFPGSPHGMLEAGTETLTLLGPPPTTGSMSCQPPHFAALCVHYPPPNGGGGEGAIAVFRGARVLCLVLRASAVFFGKAFLAGLSHGPSPPPVGAGSLFPSLLFALTTNLGWQLPCFSLAFGFRGFPSFFVVFILHRMCSDPFRHIQRHTQRHIQTSPPLNIVYTDAQFKLSKLPAQFDRPRVPVFSTGKSFLAAAESVPVYCQYSKARCSLSTADSKLSPRC